MALSYSARLFILFCLLTSLILLIIYYYHPLSSKLTLSINSQSSFKRGQGFSQLFNRKNDAKLANSSNINDYNKNSSSLSNLKKLITKRLPRINQKIITKIVYKTRIITKFVERPSTKSSSTTTTTKTPKAATATSKSLSSFQLSEMSLSEMKAINAKVKSPGEYADPKALADCSVNLNRRKVFQLFKEWIEFTSAHNVLWYLIDGTLIGQTRHKDVIPYDADVDIAILGADEVILRKYQTKRQNQKESNMNIIMRPGHHDSTRMDCSGKMVSRMVDTCAFTGPIARLMFKARSNRVDVFVYHMGNLKEKATNKSKIGVYSEEDYNWHPFDEVFPLRKCEFLRLTVLCPNKKVAFLKRLYHDKKILSPNRVCENGKWRRIQ